MWKRVIIGAVFVGTIGFGECSPAVSADVAPETLTTPAGAPGGRADSDNTTKQPAEKVLTIDDLIAAATKNGYKPYVVTQGDGKIAGLKFTKVGKTEAGYGILQKKWDEKDTIDLTLGKKLGGITIESVNRDVMIKPPIGDWIKQPSNDVPAWVINPAMTNG